mgnify:CR=1 FL=1
MVVYYFMVYFLCNSLGNKCFFDMQKNCNFVLLFFGNLQYD